MASLLHEEASAPVTECPVLGTVTSWAPGIRAWSAWAFSTGVRRSAWPSRISVGTAGSAAIGAGGGEATG